MSSSAQEIINILSLASKWLLRDAIDVLREVEGVSFTFFESRDVVRHPLVARIVSAYDRRDLHQIQPGATP